MPSIPVVDLNLSIPVHYEHHTILLLTISFFFCTNYYYFNFGNAMLTQMAKSFFKTCLSAIKHLVTNGDSHNSGIEIRYILPSGYTNVNRLPAASRNPMQPSLLYINFK